MESVIASIMPAVKEYRFISRNAVVVEVDKRDLVKTVNQIIEWVGGRYAGTFGVDETHLGKGISVNHLLAIDDLGIYMIIKCYINKDQVSSVQSLSGMIPSANWGEREVRDLLGIEFVGHPEPVRLVLSDDFPDEVHPLRKDFSVEDFPEPVEYELFEFGGYGESIPFGPYHPSLIEPEYIRLILTGEEVTDVILRPFHIHRGIEKVGESKYNIYNLHILAEKIGWGSPAHFATATVLAIENALDIEPPERANYLRMIVLELERTKSHLTWLGLQCLSAGYEPCFHEAFKTREHLMSLWESIFSNRYFSAFIVPGGVSKDFNDAIIANIVKTINKVEIDFSSLIEELESIDEFIERLRGAGTLSSDVVKWYGGVGPVARASGINNDIRITHPYLLYEDLTIEPAVETSGDALSRFGVRSAEIIESIRIVREMVLHLPSGKHRTKVKLPNDLKIGLSCVESPRGELASIIIISNKGIIYRWWLRPATFMNIQLLPSALRGSYLSDVPLVITSLDLCMACMGR
jgi:Ni,Fe-hydrogenase III large subunit/Ni,Fe-hydrogenase III component G